MGGRSIALPLVPTVAGWLLADKLDNYKFGSATSTDPLSCQPMQSQTSDKFSAI